MFTFSKYKSNSNRLGMTLLSLILGTAIVGVLAVVASSLVQNSLKTTKEIQRMGELEDLRRYFRVVISCDQTFEDNPPCNGAAVTLKKKNGEVAVKKNHQLTTVGEYEVKATCNGNQNKTIDIKVRFGKKGKWIELFKNAPFVC